MSFSDRFINLIKQKVNKILEKINKLQEQAKAGVKTGRDDLATLALERKNANIVQVKELDTEIAAIQNEQEKLENAEKRLSIKVEEFKSKKEIIKARYSSAEAEVRIKENITGISEEMSDIGVAMSRAEEKTEEMKSRAMAIEDMKDSGSLVDYTNNKDQIDSELEKTEIKSRVDDELAQLKASVNRTT